MGLRDFLGRLLPKLQHPWRKYLGRHAGWKIVPLVVFSAIMVIITIVLDAQMPASYSKFEFAFSQAGFTTAIRPFQANLVASQYLLIQGTIHYVSTFVYFTTTTVVTAWAANHDSFAMFGAVGAVGDMLCWTQAMGCVMDLIGNGMTLGAIGNVPPNGFGYADIVFTISGIQLIFKDIMLAMGVIYALTIRICMWTCYKGVDNTPDWEGHRGPGKTESTQQLQATTAMVDY